MIWRQPPSSWTHPLVRDQQSDGDTPACAGQNILPNFPNCPPASLIQPCFSALPICSDMGRPRPRHAARTHDTPEAADPQHPDTRKPLHQRLALMRPLMRLRGWGPEQGLDLDCEWKTNALSPPQALPGPRAGAALGARTHAAHQHFPAICGADVGKGRLQQLHGPGRIVRVVEADTQQKFRLGQGGVQGARWRPGCSAGRRTCPGHGRPCAPRHKWRVPLEGTALGPPPLKRPQTRSSHNSHVSFG